MNEKFFCTLELQDPSALPGGLVVEIESTNANGQPVLAFRFVSMAGSSKRVVVPARVLMRLQDAAWSALLREGSPK